MFLAALLGCAILAQPISPPGQYPGSLLSGLRWRDVGPMRGGRTVAIDGVGFSSIGRLELLAILQQRARAAGVAHSGGRLDVSVWMSDFEGECVLAWAGEPPGEPDDR